MNLDLGARLVWDGVAFELTACDATTARLRAVEEGYVRVALINELQRDPSIEWPQRELRQVRTFDPQSLKALPLPQQAKIQLWLPHVTRLDQFLSSARRDADETNRIIAEIAHSIGQQTTGGSVDPRTVWRKLQGYRDFGALGLIDKRYRTKVHKSRDPLLLEIVAAVCRQADKQSTGTRGRIVDDIIYAIADRYGEKPPFDIPSARTLDRIVNEMPRAKHLTRSAKTRASLANRPQREFQQHESPRLGEHTQIDTTKFDAEITLDNGSVTTRNGVERPEMTILLEIRSRTPMAAVLRAGGTKSVDLVTLLARALTPYERRPQGARETRELVSSAWADPHGISQEELDRYRSMVPVIFPENITVDHGKIFTSTAFTEACERLGISLIECNPYTPTGKPHVEANFGSVAEQFAQYLRSHVGRSVEHRGKDDAPHPPPTLLQAQELLDDWIAVHWMHRPHDGLRDPLRPSRALTPMETVTLLRQITPDLVIPFGRQVQVRVSFCGAAQQVSGSIDADEARRTGPGDSASQRAEDAPRADTELDDDARLLRRERQSAERRSFRRPDVELAVDVVVDAGDGGPVLLGDGFGRPGRNRRHRRPRDPKARRRLSRLAGSRQTAQAAVARQPVPTRKRMIIEVMCGDPYRGWAEETTGVASTATASMGGTGAGVGGSMTGERRMTSGVTESSDPACSGDDQPSQARASGFRVSNASVLPARIPWRGSPRARRHSSCPRC